MYIRVEARPNSRKESILQSDEKTYTISVKEPAQQNMANKRIREILAEHLNIPLGIIKMISGHRSPRKIFTIDNY